MERYALDMAATLEQRYHVLDLFGATESVSKVWREAGFEAIAFDVKISRQHDLCTMEGFKTLLRMGMQNLVSICVTPCDIYMVLEYL